MAMLNPRRLLALLLLSLCLAYASPVFAQARVRAARDQVSVWAPGFTTIVAVVKRGTEFEVIRRQDAWYEVRLPASEGQDLTGFVAVIQVETVSGTPPPSSAPVSSPP